MPFWTPVIQGVILLVDVFCFGTSYLIYKEQKDILQNLENVAIHEVNQNLEKVLQISPNKQMEYAGVRGKVFSLAQDPYYSEIKNLRDIYQTLQKFGKFITQNSYDVVRDPKQMNISYPFKLYPPVDKLPKSNQYPTVHVDGIFWWDKFNLRSNAFGERGPVFYLQSGKNHFAQENTIITVYGKVRQIASGEIRIEYGGDDTAPFIFTTSSHDALVSTQRYYVTISRLMFIGFTTFGLIVLGRFLFSEWKKYSIHRQRLKIFEELLPAITQEGENSIDQNSNLNTSTNEEKRMLCITCLTNERNILFETCKHLCVCQECAEKSNGVCPICSKVSKSLIPAYIS